jgi:hypothetical protein
MTSSPVLVSTDELRNAMVMLMTVSPFCERHERARAKKIKIPPVGGQAGGIGSPDRDDVGMSQGHGFHVRIRRLASDPNG